MPFIEIYFKIYKKKKIFRAKNILRSFLFTYANKYLEKNK